MSSSGYVNAGVGRGEQTGLLGPQHAHDAVDDVVGKFVITFSVGHSTVFQQASWGSAFSWGVSAWGWGWG